MSNMNENLCDSFLSRKSHIRYFMRFLNINPAQLASQDTVRLTIAFFAISGLDVLNALHELTIDRKNAIIDWLYNLQVVPQATDTAEKWQQCGFQGSTTLNFAAGISADISDYKCGHLAMTYTALASLVILGDDLTRVNRPAIVQGLMALQQSDGSFRATLSGSENDMRFVYCAACISYILHDWSGMDIPKSVGYIVNSISYDCGIAQGPDLESHGGTTFCAVAALSLMGQLDCSLSHKQLTGLKKWAIMRQVTGFQGRPNKPVDTCYSFWVGSTLKILGILEMVNFEENREYIYSTQDPIVGGFSKWVNTQPDPLHTYLGLCGLSLMKERELIEIAPDLNISKRALEFVHRLHSSWATK